MDIIIFIMLLFSIIAFFVGIVMLFIKSKRKSAIKMIIGGFVVFLIAAFYINEHENTKAKELGFANFEDYQAAQKQQIKDPKQWQAIKAEQAAQKAKDDANNAKLKTIEKNTEKPDQKIAQPISPDKAEQRNPRLNPEKNIKLIINALKSQKKKWQSSYSTKLCMSDNYCAINVGSLQIQAMGGTVNILLSNKASASDYMQLCSSVLSGLSGININQTNAHIIQAFREASQSGRSKYKISSVDLIIREGSDSRLVCDFFHFTDPTN